MNTDLKQYVILPAVAVAGDKVRVQPRGWIGPFSRWASGTYRVRVPGWSESVTGGRFWAKEDGLGCSLVTGVYPRWIELPVPDRAGQWDIPITIEIIMEGQVVRTERYEYALNVVCPGTPVMPVAESVELDMLMTMNTYARFLPSADSGTLYLSYVVDTWNYDRTFAGEYELVLGKETVSRGLFPYHFYDDHGLVPRAYLKTDPATGELAPLSGMTVRIRGLEREAIKAGTTCDWWRGEIEVPLDILLSRPSELPH